MPDYGADLRTDALPGTGNPSGEAEIVGPLVIILDDDVGNSSVEFVNASGTTVFKVTSLGDMQCIGLMEFVATVT